MFFNKLTRIKGFGRYACLGNSVLEALGRRFKMHNIQKGRVDYLVNCLNRSSVMCRPELVYPYLARDYIVPTIDQQARICPDFHPDLILFDSFSELTDQLFRHNKEGWKFCANFDDVDHTPYFIENFTCLGLLNLEGLKDYYTEIFRSLEVRWPKKPIIFLHFPSALETRDKFLSRSEKIFSVINELEKSNPLLLSFSVPSDIVKHPEKLVNGMGNFPYHYNQETYDAFAEMIKAHPISRKFF